MLTNDQILDLVKLKKFHSDLPADLQNVLTNLEKHAN